MREAVDAGLAAARAQATQLDEALRAWNVRAAAPLDGLASGVDAFIGRVGGDLSNLQTYVAEATAAQIARLQTHGDAVEASPGRGAAPSAAATRMMSEIASHVTRIVGDATNDAQRRIERSAAALRDENGQRRGSSCGGRAQASQVAMAAAAALSAHGAAFATDAADIERSSTAAQADGGVRGRKAVVRPGAPWRPRTRSARAASRSAGPPSRATSRRTRSTRTRPRSRLTAAVEDSGGRGLRRHVRGGGGALRPRRRGGAGFAATVGKAQADVSERWDAAPGSTWTRAWRRSSRRRRP